MLLGQPVQHDRPVHAAGDHAAAVVEHDVAGERLRPAVHGHPPLAVAADDRSQDRERHILRLGRPVRQLHQVVEHVRAGPHLGHPRHRGNRPARGRAAGRRLVQPQPPGGRHHRLALLAAGRGRVAVAAGIADAPVTGDAAQAQARQVAHPVGQRVDQRRLAGGHTAATEARVEVDEDAQLGALGHGRARQPLGGRVVLDVHPDTRPPGQARQPRTGLLRHHRIGDDHVVEAGLDVQLGLRDLGRRDAGGAGRELHPGDLQRLVGLDVRPKTDPVDVHRLLPAAQISLETVQIDHQTRRLQLIGRHPSTLQAPFGSADRYPLRWWYDASSSCW